MGEKGVGEGPMGRKGYGTKSKYLFGRLASNLIHCPDRRSVERQPAQTDLESWGHASSATNAPFEVVEVLLVHEALISLQARKASQYRSC